MAMKILVTGSSGTIGRKFCIVAEESGHQIIRDQMRHWSTQPHNIIYDDLDAVIHLAAAGVNRDTRNWPECLQTNFFHLAEFLGAIAQSKCTPKVVIARSSREQEMNENIELWSDAYVVSKRLGTMFAMDWAHHYAGKTIFALIHKCESDQDIDAVCASILKSIK